MVHRVLFVWFWCWACIWCTTEASKGEALANLREVFDLPRAPLGSEGRRQRAPQFMRALYEAVASDPRAPLRGHVVYSYRETENNNASVAAPVAMMDFNLSGLSAGDHVLEAELHLHRTMTAAPPPREHHATNGTTPYYLVRVYQRLSRGDPSAFPVDSHRLLAVQHVAAATTMATPASGAGSWHVVNVRAAVEDWLAARRPNLGFLVDVVTGDGRPPASLQRVKFDRRVSGKNSRGKEPTLIVLTHDGPTLGRQAPPGVLRRRWRSVIEGVTTRGRRNSATIPPLETAGNGSGCGLRDLWVDFGALRLSKWIASPRAFNSGQCAGGCAPGGGVATTSHAALLRALRRLGRPRSAPPPACTPSALHPLTLLACVANHCTLKVLEDLVAASCGCH